MGRLSYVLLLLPVSFTLVVQHLVYQLQPALRLVFQLHIHILAHLYLPA
jgi:hypothetical protein